MAQGPSDTILVAIRITLQIRESKVRNPDPPDRRRFVLSEHVQLTVELLKSYCMPFLLYACEAVAFSASNKCSLNNCINRAVYKTLAQVVQKSTQDIRHYLGLYKPDVLIEWRCLTFVNKLIHDTRYIGLFTRNSIYAIVRICHGNSVCLSVRHMGGSAKNG